MPPDWEKHWSDQYETYYYWNKKTGESTWDQPKFEAKKGVCAVALLYFLKTGFDE